MRLNSRTNVNILLTMLLLAVVFKIAFEQFKPALPNTPSSLPMPLKKMLQANTPQHWCVLFVTNNKLQFFNNYSTQHWLDKQQSIQTMLESIIKHGNIIPNGYYAISLEDGVHTEYPWPLLTFASETSLINRNKVVLMPDFDALNGYETLFSMIDEQQGKYKWQDKKSVIHWRGNASGTEPGPNEYNFPRLQFVQAAVAQQNIVDAAFTKYPKQTSPAVREYLKQHFPIVNAVLPQESLKYRYLMDVDGYSCSYSRMAWILYSDSLLFKHISDKEQWYYSQLKPYIHFVPISENFSDLKQQFNWAENNPERALAIISNAQQLAKEIFSPAAIEQATYQAFVDYHALTQSD